MQLFRTEARHDLNEFFLVITESELDSQLSGWLAAVDPAAEEGFAPPIKGCKAIIAPFAISLAK